MFDLLNCVVLARTVSRTENQLQYLKMLEEHLNFVCCNSWLELGNLISLILFCLFCKWSFRLPFSKTKTALQVNLRRNRNVGLFVVVSVIGQVRKPPTTFRSHLKKHQKRELDKIMSGSVKDSQVTLFGFFLFLLLLLCC